MPPKSPKLGGLFSKTGIFISRNRLRLRDEQKNNILIYLEFWWAKNFFYPFI